MSKKETLFVYLGEQFVGELYQISGLLSFQYAEGAVTPISEYLPIQQEPFQHEEAEPFFSGLLPDEPIRSKLSKILKISEQNIFALLEKLGGDCAGAITILPQKKIQENHPKTHPLSKDELFSILKSLPKRPLGIGIEGVRVSGAGAQAKLVVAKIGDSYHLPLEGTPSSHIIKPSIEAFEHSVFNEFFCMRLAQKIGLNVPKVEILFLRGEPFYVVQRYDRIFKDGKTIRLHQEDFCQVLGIPPNKKYQNEGGPSLVDLFEKVKEFRDQRRMRGVDVLNLLRLVLFNFFIGNGDGHGKNFSLLYKEGLVSLAPCYDLMSTMVYFGIHKDKMAMKIGSKYKFKDVVFRHFEQMSNETDVLSRKLVQKEIIKMAKSLPTLARELTEELATEELDSPIYQRIIEMIERQVNVFREILN